MFYECDERYVAMRARLSASAPVSASADAAATDAGVLEEALTRPKVGIETLNRLKALAFEAAEALGRSVDTAEFLRFVVDGGAVCLDVRSPGEFASGHLPGSSSLPLFSDAERHLVGITYSRQGKDPALVVGFKQVQSKLIRMREEAWRLCRQESGAGESTRLAVGVMCWRGGMRSRCVAWWLRQAGMEPVLLKGGYKALKEYCARIFWQQCTPYELSSLVRGHELTDAGRLSYCRPRIVIVGGEIKFWP